MPVLIYRQPSLGLEASITLLQKLRQPQPSSNLNDRCFDRVFIPLFVLEILLTEVVQTSFCTYYTVMIVFNTLIVGIRLSA